MVVWTGVAAVNTVRHRLIWEKQVWREEISFGYVKCEAPVRHTGVKY